MNNEYLNEYIDFVTKQVAALHESTGEHKGWAFLPAMILRLPQTTHETVRQSLLRANQQGSIDLFPRDQELLTLEQLTACPVDDSGVRMLWARAL